VVVNVLALHLNLCGFCSIVVVNALALPRPFSLFLVLCLAFWINV
jgi:hypothetical protein